MRSAACVIAGIWLAACSGGAGSPPANGGALTSAIARGNVALVIPSSLPARSEHHREFVSPSTASVSIAVTGIATPVVADVSATSTLCTTTATGRSCTIAVLAPVGSDTFSVTLYGSAGATGAVLGTGATTQTISAGSAFSAAISVAGAPASIAISVAVATFTAGTAATSAVSVSALDAGGNVITGTYAQPITLTNSDTTGTFTLSPKSISASGTAVTLSYSGGAGATTATISAAATNVPVADVTAATVAVGPSTSGPNLYVAQIGSNAFTVTPESATGNVAPLRTVSGAITGMSEPYGIAVDGNGVEYTANFGASTVTVFAAGANGNVAPIRTISGLSAPVGLGIDSSTNLYVTNFGADSVAVYAPGATGNATPLRTLSGAATGIGEPYGLTLDASNNLYLVNNYSQFGGVDTVTVYAAGANGNVAPTRTITGTLTKMSGAVFDAVDAAGNIYVSNAYGSLGTGSVTVYGPGANGNVAPIREITGTATMLDYCGGVAVDAAGRLYVVNDGGGSISVFAAGANGNVAPIQYISGSLTGMSGPDQITFGP